jgi:hypothetical protein
MRKVCPYTGGEEMTAKPERIKDGRCHAHCQVGCEYKCYGACMYDGDDGCEGQYVKEKNENRT